MVNTDEETFSNIDDLFAYLINASGYSNYTSFFTDGSRIPEVGVGCGIYAKEGRIKEAYNLCDLLDIFDAEAVAVSHALRIIHSRNIYKANIFTDSLSIFTAVSQPSPPGGAHHLVANIRDILHSMHREGYSVRLIWLPGHIGIFGNETADGMAKQAAKNIEVTGPHRKFIFPSNLYTELRKCSEEEAIRFVWEQANTKGFQYFNRVKEKSFRPWFHKIHNLNRTTIKIISRIRSHHVNLAHHRHPKKSRKALTVTAGR